MRKLVSLFFCTVLCGIVNAQEQSIIYDATVIMNAKHNISAFLVPKPGTGNAFDAREPLTGKLISVSLDNYFQNHDTSGIIDAILCRYADLPAGTDHAVIMAAYKNNPFIKSIDLFAAPDKSTWKTVKALPADKNSAGAAANILGKPGKRNGRLLH